MSESIKLKHLSDIRNVQWYFENGGRIKRKNGTYKAIDYYPEYYYNAKEYNPVSINNKPIKWINFRMISPRTKTHFDKIGLIKVVYKFETFQNNMVFTDWIDEWSVNDWLKQNVTSGLNIGNSSIIEVPQHRRAIQKGNEQQEEYDDDYDDDNDIYQDEYDNFYNYRDYSYEDMIQDAFEGDASLLWNID